MSEETVNGPASTDPSSTGFDVSVPDIPMPEEVEVPEIKDTFTGGFKFAFIGSGQGGGRIAQAFYKIGYRRVCAVNTASQDLETLALPTKKCIGVDGGAGKNPSVAKAAFAENKEDILDFMRRTFGPSIDRIFVCVGAGGGTGAGSAVHLVDTAVELQKSIKANSQQVGVIVAIPKVAEGKRVAANAFNTLTDLLELTRKGVISPLIIVDNEKIGQLYPKLAVDPFWDTANASVASLFHLFNTICTKNSHYTSFDRADLLTVLNSGMITFGAMPVKFGPDMSRAGDEINFAVRNGLKRNILSGGVDLGTGTVAASVVIGDTNLLSTLPQAYIEQAFDQLNRIMKTGSTVHRGIYRGDKPGMVVYTIIGGLGRPEEKLAELKRLADFP